MTTIISITAQEKLHVGTRDYEYSGEDRILQNIISGDYEVLYSGQNQGRQDEQLLDAVMHNHTFRVYYRRKVASPFIFLGSTNYSSIVRERTISKRVNSLPNERLQIRLVIPRTNIIETEIGTTWTGSGKYKKAILEHSGFNTNLSAQIGFYTKK